MTGLVRQTLRDSRVRTIAFAYLFAAIAYLQPVAYRSAYKTRAARLAFARSFGPNVAVRMSYGEPHNLVTITGYTAWRVGGTLAIFAMAWGVMAAVRALRTEEESGHTELILAGPTSRGSVLTANLTAITLGGLLLWAADFGALALAGLPLGGSAFLALTALSVASVFVGIGAIASELASTRRVASELASAVAAAMFVLRVVADTASGFGWLRWLTPLGWAENMRPFTGAQPAVLALPVATTVALLWASRRISARRDIGTGLIPVRDHVPARLGLLSSPTAQTLRDERGSLLTWAVGLGALGVIVGALANSTGNGAVSKPLRQQIAKLGAGSIATPAGYLGLTLIFFILAVSLFGCAQLGTARREEAEQRLETLLALPVGRSAWLGGRLLLAGCAIVALSLLTSLCAWLGATAAGASVPASKMAEAGINFVPVALLFLGIAALAYAVVPRAAGAIAYGAVIVAFVWQLFGALLDVPSWLINATPFAHVALIPAAPAKVGAAIAMLAIAAALLASALVLIGRRDLAGA